MDSAPGQHLLYVAWGFPPCRSGGVNRALATANAFAADGWQVTVVTIPRELFATLTGTDDALEAYVDPRIDVRRIPFEWPAVDTDIRRYPLARVLTPRLWARVRKWRDQLPFPEVGYGPWRIHLEEEAERIHAERPVDLVLATTNPQVSITAATCLHRTHGVPYVIDYRDAWSLDVFSGRRLHAAGSRVGRIEREAFAGAREIWFVNEPIRRWHAAAYPESASRMHVVPNGYDVPAPGSAAAQGVAPRGPSLGDPDDADERPRFGYVGTMTRQVPLEEFVAGWRLARWKDPGLATATAELHGYLGHYATPATGLTRIVDAAAEDRVAYCGPVSKTRVREVYERFDVLLLILGAGRYVTSGKVYEYMSTGLPIVSVHDPRNAASDVLRGYPRWHSVSDLSPESIAAALASAAEDARDPGEARAAAKEFGQRYRRDRQLAPRLEALRHSTVEQEADLEAARRFAS